MKGSIYTDGACKGNPGPGSIGVVVKNRYGNTIDTHSELLGHTTSNTAEYRALLKGLDMAKEHGITDLDCFTDSLLMVNHLHRSPGGGVTTPLLVNHMMDIRNKLQHFDNVKVVHIRRHFNKEADSVANEVFRKNKIVEQVEASSEKPYELS